MEVLSLVDLLLLASIGIFMVEAHKFLIDEGAFRLKLFMFSLAFDEAESEHLAITPLRITSPTVTGLFRVIKGFLKVMVDFYHS